MLCTEDDALPRGCSVCAALAQAPAGHTDLRGNADMTDRHPGESVAAWGGDSWTGGTFPGHQCVLKDGYRSANT